MSEKSTPGPWKVGHWGGQCLNELHVAALRHPGPPECVYVPQFFAGYGGIAGSAPNQMVVDTHYDELVISDADANVIAAAPDLLGACKLALTLLEEFVQGAEDAHEQLRAAIAKAEGQS